MLAHALIQRQKGTERIALGQIPPERAVICSNVKVDALFETFFRKMFAAHFDALVCSLLFIS